jgi:hypothetical protein
MLFHNFLIEKGTHVDREPRVFWEDTRQPVERGSECRATYTLATALTTLPQWRGLPRESPLQCRRACRLEPEPASPILQYVPNGINCRL